MSWMAAVRGQVLMVMYNSAIAVSLVHSTVRKQGIQTRLIASPILKLNLIRKKGGVGRNVESVRY